MPHSTTSTLTADDKRKIKSAVPPSTCHIFGMARGQIYHAPFTASSPSEWEPLDLRGVIVFGRDTKKYEIQDDASSGGSSRGSLASAGTSGSSGSSGSIRASDVANEEPGSVSGLGDGDGTLDLAAGLGVKDDDLWFRLVEIDPHQKKPSKVVWRQPVSSASSDYKVLVPFFHAFSGNSRLFGFKFDDDNEAHQFSEAVMVRIKARPLVKPALVPNPWSKSARRRKTKLSAPVLNQVSNPEPGSFQHKAHSGIDDEREGSFSSGEPVRPRPRRSSTVLGSRRLKRYLRN